MPLELSSEALVASNPATSSVTTIVTVVSEGETSVYSVQLTGPGGAPIANTDFSAITLSHVDELTKAVINSRSQQDVLGGGSGQNNVTLSAAALLTWNLQAADNVVIDPTQTRKTVYNRAIFTFTFDIGAGTEIGIHEVRIPVRKAFIPVTQTFS